MNTKKNIKDYREALELRQLAEAYYKEKDEKRRPAVIIGGICFGVVIILILIIAL
jgi:hypothetical protein